jgi:ATP-binding cassette subfamily B protein/subfamily B ATP-binding cassette protein MsbA
MGDLLPRRHFYADSMNGAGFTMAIRAKLQWERLWRLLHYARARRGAWAFIIAITLLSTAFSVLQPWPMKVLVDHALGHEPMSPALRRVMALLPGTGTPAGVVAWVALAGLVIFAVNSALDVVLTWSWIRTGQGMVYDLAGDLFSRIQRRSLLFHTRHPVGDSMMRVTGDSWCVHTVVDTLLFAPVHALITAFAMAALMLQLNVPLTLLSLATAPLMTAFSLLLGKRLRARSHAQREIESGLQSHVQQTFAGMPVVQAFAQEDREHARFEQLTHAAIRALRRTTLTGSLAGLGSGLITTTGTGAVLLVGSRQVLHARLSVGSLLVFMTYLGSLQAQLNALAGIYTALQAAGAGIDRVSEVLEAEPEVVEKPGAVAAPRAAGHIRYEDVEFGYDPGRSVLRDVWLEALPGQMVAVVGPTGAGKSTLMGLIPRFFDPQKGRVTLDGRDLRDWQLRALREQVALVLQEPFLFPISIAGNIAFGRPDASRGQIEAVARAANAHSFIEKLENGYDTVIGERGATLSGGERQRLSIARALLKDAPVLILDEPTSSLDLETEYSILQALERLMKGRTTFIIAHRLSTICRADRIAVLDEGRIVEFASHVDLLASGGLYARLHGIQSGSASAGSPTSATGSGEITPSVTASSAT